MPIGNWLEKVASAFLGMDTCGLQIEKYGNHESNISPMVH